ncbi:hypothetical protein [Geodermatophilus sp. URMC 63]
MTPPVPAGGAELLVWPVVAVVGFLALAGLVVVLGRSSTARYEFERNAVRQQRPHDADGRTGPATGPGTATGIRVPAVPAGPGAAAAPSGAVAPGRPAARTAVGLATHPAPHPATHPAGRQLGAGSGATAWWLVDSAEDRPGQHAVAGPFAARADALCTALATGLDGSVRAVHGVLRADGTVVRRISAQDSAWLAHLGDQLDRLPEDWDTGLAEEDPLAGLVVEVAAALTEAGLPLWDATGPDGALGGVCLSAEPALDGIVVAWRQHDRMSVDQVYGADVDVDVQQVLNAALADVLAVRGFDAEPLGGAASGCLVRGAG